MLCVLWFLRGAQQDAACALITSPQCFCGMPVKTLRNQLFDYDSHIAVSLSYQKEAHSCDAAWQGPIIAEMSTFELPLLNHADSGVTLSYLSLLLEPENIMDRCAIKEVLLYLIYLYTWIQRTLWTDVESKKSLASTTSPMHSCRKCVRLYTHSLLCSTMQACSLGHGTGAAFWLQISVG